ncbi:MAG: cytochrome b N-terminal domain-containing protein [Alphaproteobacteria bacterium]|nr:cytochrome b N-terminal domain-containing protein [Alphaproteobacteria bacterium]
MSGPSTYDPKTGIERWLDQRLPIVRMMHDSFVDYPTPRNLNYFWTFGAILMLCLVTQIVTGIVLAMHYTPSIAEAFNSIQRLKRDVPFGWLIQNIHATGASMFFLAVYIHMFRGLYYGSYKAPREVLWILGVVIYLLMMATAFLGYVLPWGQMSFWGATVITNFFSAIPVVGEPVKEWLMGGFAIDNPTLNRFFSLHYLMPFVIFGVVILHVWALHVSGQNNPDGIEVKDKADTVAFTPYATIKDLFAAVLFMLMFATFVFFLPDALGHPDNYIPADPLKTPPHIVPEWYLLPFYAILRAIDFAVGPISAKLGGLILMVGAIAVLVVLPWLDTSKVRSMRYRPVARWFFLIFVVVCLVLGWCGAQSPDKIVAQPGEFRIDATYRPASGAEQTLAATGHTLEEAEKAFDKQRLAAVDGAGPGTLDKTVLTPFQFKVTQLSQILTLYYFAFFLLILPILGLRETPNRVPETIAKAIGAKRAAANKGA